MATWNDPCPQCGAELYCLHRPRPMEARPVGCRLSLAAVALLLAGCTSTATTVKPLPPEPVGSSGLSTPATLGCAWYTPTSVSGQAVTVTATGPACTGRSVIGLLTRAAGRPWTSESLIPGSYGHPLASLTRGDATVQVYFTGPLPSHNATASPGTQSDTPAAELAGRIAQALQDDGWRPTA